MTIKIISKANSDEIKKPVKHIGEVLAKKKIRKPTLFQEKVIKITKETLGAKGRKSKAQIIREAGGSEVQARHPDRVFDSEVVQDAIAPVIKKMRDIRTKALDALDGKDMTKESAFNLTMMIGMLTKDSELLDGRPTDIQEYQLPPEEKARLDRLLKLNS